MTDAPWNLQPPPICDSRHQRASGSTVNTFRRVEVYGDPTARWVRLTVDPDRWTLFTITSPPTP